MITNTPITMTEEVISDRPSSPSSVHLHQVDAELQYDASFDVTIDTNIYTPQRQVSLIRLESGRKIWWLDNAISSHRGEVMLRRRRRYLQEEQRQQQQQQQQIIIRENYYNNISADSGHDLDRSSVSGCTDVVTQSNCEKGGQHNNFIPDSDDYHDMTAANEQSITTAVSSSQVVNAALPMKMNAKITSQPTINNTINAVNEVSLESIDEQTTLLPHHQQLLPQSNQQVLQYCHDNNIPVVTVGTTTAATVSGNAKKTWLDFGEDDVNVVGQLSTRQFLIHASTPPSMPTSPTYNAANATTSATFVEDNYNTKQSPINITIERLSSQEGFICMLLHDSSSSINHHTTNTTNYNGSSCSLDDPIQLQLKNGESQMIHVVWNPMKEGCVRENIELVIHTGDQQEVKIRRRHEIVFVGSARDSRTTKNNTYFDSSDVTIEKDEWNGVSIEYSEIREEASQSELVVEGVGLTITEEDSSVLTDGGDGGANNNLIDSNEVHEIAQMMTKADISPKKATMAAKSLSQVSAEAGGVEQVMEVSNRQVKTKQIMAVPAQEEMMIDSERLFADENRLIPQTSQDFVNGLYMNDKVRHLLDDFDAESASTDDGRSGRSTPTFGSLSSEEEEKECILSDASQRHYDDEQQQVESQVDTAEEEIATDETKRDVASAGGNLKEKQQSAERFVTTMSDHYDKVTAELNALMEDVTEEVQSESDSDNDSYLSSEDCNQSRDEKLAIRNFNETTSNGENEELNVLPETSIDNSSDWDSSGTDMSIDSDRRRQNPYRQMTSDLDALMVEFSELEQFAQMQQDYLISPTTHDFQTQLENINEQIDNLTPSPANAMIFKTAPSNSMSEKRRPALRIKETRVVKTANEPPTPKDSAQKCYFYKPPPKENRKLTEQSPTLSPQSRDQIEEKKVPYKSPFAAVLEAETSFQSIDSMLDGSSSSDESICASESECDESNSLDSMSVDSSSFDESTCSNESELDVSNNSSADLDDDDTSASLASSESTSPARSQNMGTNIVAIKSTHETRSEQIASMKSKLSSLKVKSSESGANDQLCSPLVSRARQYSSPTKIPQLTSSTRMLQLKTPVLQTLDVASLTASASTAQKSKARQYSSPSKIPQPTSSTRMLQLKTPVLKSLDVSSLTASAITAQKSNARQYSSPSKIPQPTSSTRKLKLKTPAIKQLNVASLAASASTSQKSARMTYGYFSQSPTENSPSDSETTGMSQTPMKRSQLKTQQSLKTPASKSTRAPTQLKTPSSMSAYEKHIERMRSSRKQFS
jgi:hypothetical protein